MTLDPGTVRKLLWNEAVVKNSYLLRRGRSGKPYFSERTNAHRSRLVEIVYRVGYNVSVLWGFISLLLRPRCRDLPPGRIFLFSDPRQMRGDVDGSHPFSIGIYKRHGGYCPLELLLNKSECVRVFIEAGMVILCKSRYVEAWRGAEELFGCTNFGFFRYLDLTLASVAVGKVRGRTILYAGHFDPYVMMISLGRKSGGGQEFIFRQHGLFELPTGFYKYERVYADRCELLYRESESYVRRAIVADGVRVVVRETRSGHICDTGCAEAIAVALQLDDFSADLGMLKLIKEVAPRCRVIVYPHPSTRKADLFKISKLLQDETSIFLRHRHSDIRLLVTRYSSLGMDYLSMGVPVIFWNAGVSVCVFDSGRVNVVGSYLELSKAIRRIIE